MRLEISSLGLQVGREFRDSIERRLRFVLGRFGPQIGRVTVHLVASDQPRASRDKRCRIIVSLVRSGRVCVEIAEADALAAMSRAADRIGPALTRELMRRRDRRLTRQEERATKRSRTE
jgi:ribosome-associated translation inhibitor RaiA